MKQLLRFIRRLKLKKIISFLISLAIFYFILLGIGVHRYNAACSVCHEMRDKAGRLESAGHKDLACINCHKPPMPLRTMFNAKLKDDKFKETVRLDWQKQHGGYDNGTTIQCKKCHEKILKKEFIFNNILFSHERHDKRAPGCSQCHKSSAHRNKPSDELAVPVNICSDCHKKRPQAETPPKNAIPDLHVYEHQPHPGNWIVTHKTDGADKSRNCSKCHTEDYCRNCHTKLILHGPDWRSQHGTEAQKDLAPCQVCHLPEGCTDCHLNALPKNHDAAWPIRHSSELDVNNCLKCHRLNFCKSCHLRSRPSSHTDNMIRNHAGFSLGKEPACAICHDQNPCMNCHKIEIPHPVKWISTHGGKYKPKDQPICDNCHKKDYCLSCHSKKTPASHSVRAVWSKGHGKAAIKSPDNCSVCHAQQFCVSCHNMQMPHPKNWQNTHRPSAIAKPAACKICHADNYCYDCHAKSKPASHSDPSVDFSKKHGRFAKQNSKNCSVCHKQNFCDNCHGLPIPHKPAFLKQHRDTVKKDGEKFCARCHATQFCKDCHTSRVKHEKGWLKTHSAAAVSDVNRCLTCHNPVDCLSCHKNPVANSKNIHPDCLYCHDDKTMKFLGLDVCGNCHDDEKTQAEAITAKQNCAICHKPHVWKIKAANCAACHNMAKEGLHSKSDHSECDACHIKHSWKVTKRDVCTTCHGDKDDHNQPDLCWDCHPFKK